MARINKEHMKAIRKDRTSIHSIVDCNYLVIQDGNTKLVQLETLGKGTRQCVGTPSQTIQLDEDTVEFILSLFQK